jgi:manganese efflux pump family protein
MTFYYVLLLAFGLAMDAFAVAVSSGGSVRPMPWKYGLRLATFFGLFQALMHLLGWLGGMELKKFISGFDHWLAFILLVLVACRMIYAGLGPQGKNPNRMVNTPTLLLLSLATSMDALAAGISLSFLEMPIVFPALVIGAVTFALALLGAWLGSVFGRLIGRKFEVVGGLVLIAIAVKILLDHLAG